MHLNPWDILNSEENYLAPVGVELTSPNYSNFYKQSFAIHMEKHTVANLVQKRKFGGAYVFIYHWENVFCTKP